ncbi:hypothetical protein CIG75_04925 [Tumebacillus algifaecis]|uniref:Adhesin domain-containing protein n=2 Tax=Tumebacillus algifaecis TaxID=1214604 RepID=A0A223CYI4_9BACL|nr:hypothetical protein CIG75_04925 [Tumebacillus algifaecis]
MLALGLLLFYDIGFQQNAFVIGLNFWPLLIIGLGLELLWNWLSNRRKRIQERIRLDGRSLALLFLVGVFSVNFYLSTTRAAQGEEQVPQKPLLTVTSKNLDLPTQIVHLPELVKELVIDNPLGTIEVVGTTGRQMEIDAVAHVSIINERSTLVSAVDLMPYTMIDKVSTVLVKKPDHVAESARIDLKLQVPEGLELRLRTEQGDILLSAYKGNAKIGSKGGEVTVDTLNGNLETDVQNGALNVREIYGKANLHTGQGNVKIRKVGSDLLLRSDAGDADIGQVAGKLDLYVKLGKVNVDSIGDEIKAIGESAVFNIRNPFSKLEATINGIGDVTVHGDVLAAWTIAVNNGKTTLEMPESASVKFLGETNKGVIKGPTKTSKNAGTKQGSLLTDQLGDGTWPVTVRSYHGSIFVDKY